MEYFAPQGSDFCQRVEKSIEEIEARSQAEIVVVVARRSDSYQAIRQRWFFLLSLLLLCLLYFPLGYYPALIVSLGLGSLLWYLSNFPQLGRYLIPQTQREVAVLRAARLAFFSEAVSSTKGRCAILFFFSRWERRLEIVPDVGVEGQISNSLWNELEAKINSLPDLAAQEEAFQKMLADLAETLAQRYPLPAGTEKQNEIPNARHFI